MVDSIWRAKIASFSSHSRNLEFAVFSFFNTIAASDSPATPLSQTSVSVERAKEMVVAAAPRVQNINEWVCVVPEV
ncbi:unnamed protein product [Prunus armeniaca]|uniref:Uncharacterized protein n=1 Tax=Prunus armeniaca TaxID=36596 RepID=A0A6J5X8B0_PRUAR|nr:unnamed protein product [Prunus armeniaca]